MSSSHADGRRKRTNYLEGQKHKNISTHLFGLSHAVDGGLRPDDPVLGKAVVVTLGVSPARGEICSVIVAKFSATLRENLRIDITGAR